MRKSTRCELNKLRELFWYLIRGKRCAYCKELFVEDDEWLAMPHGTGHGRPLDGLQITIDHVADARTHGHTKTRLMHKKCHGRHHAFGPNGIASRKAGKASE